MSFFLFYKIGEQEGRTGPAWEGWYQWEEEEDGERAWKGEYDTNSIHTCT
jgi:hypothetical protein